MRHVIALFLTTDLPKVRARLPCQGPFPKRTFNFYESCDTRERDTAWVGGRVRMVLTAQAASGSQHGCGEDVRGCLIVLLKVVCFLACA